MTEDPHIIKKGHLAVGDGHEIYFEEWGDSNGIPFVYLHGGPGGGFSESNKSLFDPQKHHVIFHDQRGCGRSTPYASTEHNTTQDLIADINALAKHFDFTSFILVGGSWGATLALLYTISHPERVTKLIIWSVYLVRKFEMDYVNEGHAKDHFPEAWDRFISLLPKDKQKTGDEIMHFYAEQIRSHDEKTAKKFATEWTLWEATLVSKNYNKQGLEAEVLADDNFPLAMLETHYFLNKCFIPDNYILDNIPKIAHIPAFIIQGRFDMCVPPVAAWDLAKAYGEKATLQWTNGGHLRSEPENFVAIKATINAINK